MTIIPKTLGRNILCCRHSFAETWLARPMGHAVYLRYWPDLWYIVTVSLTWILVLNITNTASCDICLFSALNLEGSSVEHSSRNNYKSEVIILCGYCYTVSFPPVRTIPTLPIITPKSPAIHLPSLPHRIPHTRIPVEQPGQSFAGSQTHRIAVGGMTSLVVAHCLTSLLLSTLVQHGKLPDGFNLLALNIVKSVRYMYGERVNILWVIIDSTRSRQLLWMLVARTILVYFRKIFAGCMSKCHFNFVAVSNTDTGTGSLGRIDHIDSTWNPRESGFKGSSVSVVREVVDVALPYMWRGITQR